FYIALGPGHYIESTLQSLLTPFARGRGVVRDVDLSELRQRPELSGQNAADACCECRRRPSGSVRGKPSCGARSAVRRVRIRVELRRVRRYAPQGSPADDRRALGGRLFLHRP